MRFLLRPKSVVVDTLLLNTKDSVRAHTRLKPAKNLATGMRGANENPRLVSRAAPDEMVHFPYSSPPDFTMTTSNVSGGTQHTYAPPARNSPEWP